MTTKTIKKPCCCPSLFEAIDNGNIERLKKVLENREIDINKRCLYNMTPLMYAVDAEQNEVVCFLLQNGANPSCCFNNVGDCLLTSMFLTLGFRACFSDRAFELMFKAGMDLNDTRGYIGSLYGGPIGVGVRFGLISPKVLSLAFKHGLSYSTYKKFVCKNETCERYFRLFPFIVAQYRRKIPPDLARVLASLLLDTQNNNDKGSYT
jgi:ankyrin repeat protein